MTGDDGRTTTDEPTVGVVGAGITGLALTHHLADRGIDVQTVEAADQPGGVIQSRHVDGHVLEAGPQRMRYTPGIADLAQAAGVADDRIEAQEEQLYVYADGALGRAPLSVEAFFRTDLLSWPAKLRMVAEPLTRQGMDEETAEQLFVRKFGREAYEKFIGPLYGGIYGSDPAEMPAAYALEGLLRREQKAGSLLQAFRQRVGKGHTSPPVSFAEGNQQLPNALADTYSDRIEFETPVEEITPLDEDRYRLHTPDGARDVDHVVVTTPARVASDLLDGLADGAAQLGDLRYNPLAMVFLDADHAYAGKGYQVGYGEDLHTLGVSWNAEMFDRDGVQTVFLGGMHDPAILDESDEHLAEVARREFEQVVGVDSEVIDVARLDPGFPAWDQTWWNLESLDLPDGVTLATNYTARMGIPSRVREARELADRLDSELPDRDSQSTATPAVSAPAADD